MGKKGQNEVWIMWILKSLLAAYVVTGILLMILAMALYKFELTEEAVTAGITAVYILWETQRSICSLHLPVDLWRVNLQRSDVSCGELYLEFCTSHFCY